MKISTRIASVGAVPMTVSVLIVVAVWLLLLDGDRAREAASLAGRIHHELLIAETARIEFPRATPDARASVVASVESAAAIAADDVEELATEADTPASRAAVDAVRAALSAYRGHMSALAAVTLENDGLIAAMTEQSNLLIDLTEQARQRQHAANRDVERVVAETSRRIRSGGRLIEAARELDSALSQVWRTLAVAALVEAPYPGASTVDPVASRSAAARAISAARVLRERLDGPAEARDMAAAIERRPFEEMEEAIRIVSAPRRSSRIVVDAALSALIRAGRALDGILKVWIPFREGIEDEMANLTAYSLDADAVNSGVWDIARDVLRMSRKVVDALERREVEEVDNVLTESRATGNRVAALALSPLIQDSVIRSLATWRTNLEKVKAGLARQNSVDEAVDLAAGRMIEAGKALDDRFLVDASRVGARIRSIIAWGATGCILLGGIAAFLASMAILRPVRRLHRRMLELASDPMAGDVGDADRRDELGDMARALGRLIATIREREARLTRANEQLFAAHRELERAAAIDALTGLCNRRRLDEVFDRQVESTRKSGAPLSIIMIDADQFKHINDTFGHQVGDRVLTEIAEIFRTTVRAGDWVGRWGGEEFMIICPDTDLDRATALAETLRRNVSLHVFGEAGTVTCSLGIAVFRSGDRCNTMAKRADDALYRAKRDGRNRVEREA